MQADKSRSKTWWKTKVALGRKNTWSLMPGFTFTLLCLTLWQSLGDKALTALTEDVQLQISLIFQTMQMMIVLRNACGSIDPPSTHCSSWGANVPFPSAIGLVSYPMICASCYTQNFYLTLSTVLINWHFWSCLPQEFCHPCFTVSTAFLTLSNYSSKIFHNRWYKHVLSNSGFSQLSINIPHYPKAGRESAESLWS